jgi:hypothetical protein
MARPEAKMIMGYLLVKAHHHAALVSLVAPGRPTHKLPDPYAGEGEFLAVAAQGCFTVRFARAQ